jgi:hypothetical protein
MTNLPDKLDRLMGLMGKRFEIVGDSRHNVEQCLIQAGWIDLNPVQINSLKNLAYLAVAQTHSFGDMKALISSHMSDYADCEDFLNKRNELIQELIGFATPEAQPFGGICRDTMKGGLCRIQDGRVPRDVDLLFGDRDSLEHFGRELHHWNKYICTRTSVDMGYGIGGLHESFRVYLRSDTTISIKVDCVCKEVIYPDLEKAESSIDFNVNALIGCLHGKHLLYGVREDLQNVPGLTLSEIAADIEKKQFRAIGILMNTTPLSDKVFSDKTAHVCAHRNSMVGRKMRTRADSLIARGWTLTTSCEHPECWLGSKDVYEAIQKQRYEERRRLLVAQRKQEILAEAEMLEEETPIDDGKQRGYHRRRLLEKHHK